VHFLGVPILHSPWASFSLNNERKSGFLIPRYGSSSDSGFEFVLPYYWNIAPNMDATLRVPDSQQTRLSARHRISLSQHGVWRNVSWRGCSANTLPDDRKTNTDRWGVVLNHSQTRPMDFPGHQLHQGFGQRLLYRSVQSNHQHLEDTTPAAGGAELTVAAVGGTQPPTCSLSRRCSPTRRIRSAKPYRLLPQITVNARQPDLFSTDSAFFGQYTAFVHPDADKVEGQRIVLQPQVSLPYVTPGWYVIPRLGVNFTQYSLSYPNSAMFFLLRSAAPCRLSASIPG
jgi:LPS-assembly protein